MAYEETIKCEHCGKPCMNGEVYFYNKSQAGIFITVRPKTPGVQEIPASLKAIAKRSESACSMTCMMKEFKTYIEGIIKVGPDAPQ